MANLRVLIADDQVREIQETADQLQNVLHGNVLHDIAAKSGMDLGQLGSIFSQLLPNVVDKLTPNGQVPDSAALSQMMKGLAAGRSS